MEKIMISSKGLLYIEPNQPASNEPVIDQLTRKMAAALNDYLETGVFTAEGSFTRGVSTKGRHICSCGAQSHSVDYRLAGDVVTNSLAVHYLAHHRDEVPAEMLQRVSLLASPPVEPFEEQLQSPKSA